MEEVHMKTEAEDFPDGAVDKNLPVNAGDMGWIPCAGLVQEDLTCLGATKPRHHNY